MLNAIYTGLLYGCIAGFSIFGMGLTIAALWIVLNVLADIFDTIAGTSRRHKHERRGPPGS